MHSTLAGAAAAALGFSLGAAVFSAAAVMTLTDIAGMSVPSLGQEGNNGPDPDYALPEEAALDHQ